MTINELQDEIIEEFDSFDDWIERYELIIEYAKELEKDPLPESDRTEQNLIDGCQSKVWFTCTYQDGKIYFKGDSDALLVKGIVALLINVLSGHTPKEIVEANLYFIDAIGLREHLSPTRTNGVVAMLKQMKLFALAYQAK
jgi:cysteine desulfuration protein SufE